ncbi:MAG: ATP-binding cassette domain-containing protein [Desulfomonilaceae bacterium]
MEASKILVELNDVSVRIGQATILSHLTWLCRVGENWAVLGGNASGKSTFLSLIRGDIWPAPGAGQRIYRTNGQAAETPIGFRENTGLVSSELLDVYRTMGWNLTGLEVVSSGLQDAPILSGNLDEAVLKRASEVMATLRIEELADRRLLTMSQGEAKKILIARAMVQSPSFLFLDEIFAGLDARSKDMMMELLQRVIDQGTQILCAAYDVNEIPAGITHALVLQSGKMLDQGRISDVSAGSIAKSKNKPRVALVRTFEPEAQKMSSESLVQVEEVDVFQGGTKILEQINWTIGTGQNWALLGKNGSGKTTLLKLIAGELRPVWGGKIRRFGRNDSQSLWEIRNRISLVTPDFQAMHASGQTGLDMVLSGFYGSVGLFDEPTQSQVESARSWFQLLGADQLENREVRTLSYGQIRILLVMRAVVNRPRILLLDEPLSGLDDDARDKILSIVEEFARGDTCVIYVSHRQDELFSGLTHVAALENGRMMFQGTRKEWQRESLA